MLMCHSFLTARGVNHIRTIRKPERLKPKNPRLISEKLKILKKNRRREACRATAKFVRRRRKQVKKERGARKILRKRNFLRS